MRVIEVQGSHFSYGLNTSDDHDAEDYDCNDEDGGAADDEDGGAADDDIHLQFSLLRPRVGSLEPATRILRLLQKRTASMLMVAMMMTRVVMNKRKMMLATMMTKMMTMTA